MSDFQKISVNFSTEVLGTLKEMAKRHNITVTEVLRRAISTQVFVEKVQDEGRDLLVRDPATRETERVIFR